MNSLLFLIASSFPFLVLCLIFIIFRKSPLGKLTIIQLIALAVSIPLGFFLVSLETDVGLIHPYHNPGVGVVFAIIFLFSLLCFFIVGTMTIVSIFGFFLRKMHRQR